MRVVSKSIHLICRRGQATTDDQCHEGQCGGWQSFPTVIESQQQKAAWLSCEAERHAKLSDVGPDNGGWLGVDLENCGDCKQDRSFSTLCSHRLLK